MGTVAYRNNRPGDTHNMCIFLYNLIYSMAILVHRGEFEFKWFRKKASTALAINTLVAESSDDDTVEPADASDTAVIGVVQQVIASTDSDYADNTRVLVALPRNSSSEFLCDTASTIAVTDEGELHDLTDAATVNQAASTTDIMKLKQFVSTTKGIYTINKRAFV
jgi:hypothetical protein